MTDLCTVPECGSRAAQARLCWRHYQRKRRHGDVSVVKKEPGAAQRWLADHVAHSGEACLTWPFAKNPTGYGVVELRGRQTSVQFAMCTLAHGPAPSPDHQAAHSCGNGRKACANPRHLRWATRAENAADQLDHGTRARGERQGSSKLTEADVRNIRARAKTELQRDIAADYGVQPSQVSRIVRGAQWAWLEDREAA